MKYIHTCIRYQHIIRCVRDDTYVRENLCTAADGTGSVGGGKKPDDVPPSFIYYYYYYFSFFGLDVWRHFSSYLWATLYPIDKVYALENKIKKKNRVSEILSFSLSFPPIQPFTAAVVVSTEAATAAGCRAAPARETVVASGINNCWQMRKKTHVSGFVSHVISSFFFLLFHSLSLSRSTPHPGTAACACLRFPDPSCDRVRKTRNDGRAAKRLIYSVRQRCSGWRQLRGIPTGHTSRARRSHSIIRARSIAPTPPPAAARRVSFSHMRARSHLNTRNIITTFAHGRSSTQPPSIHAPRIIIYYVIFMLCVCMWVCVCGCVGIIRVFAGPETLLCAVTRSDDPPGPPVLNETSCDNVIVL